MRDYLAVLMPLLTDGNADVDGETISAHVALDIEPTDLAELGNVTVEEGDVGEGVVIVSAHFAVARGDAPRERTVSARACRSLSYTKTR